MSPSSSQRRARGGRGGAEPRARIVTREKQVWDLSMEGVAQRAIAEQVGISQAAVSKILKRVVERDYRPTSSQVVHRRSLIHARRGHLLAKALQEFARSGEDEVCKVQRRRLGGTAAQRGQEHHEIRVRTRVRDPRYLQLAGELLDAEERALPPETLTPPSEPIDLRSLTKDELDVLHRIWSRTQAAPTASSREEPPCDR